MKKVSVVIPVYHVGQYLKNCIESVLKQTYANMECILVDDGGDDECPQICDEYAKMDSRIICVHKQNEGQSMARKAGLAKTSGDYIMFVDGDDWLEQNAVQLCVEAAESNQADIVMFGYNRSYPTHSFETSLFEEARIFTGDEVKTLHRRMVGMVGSELSKVENQDRLVTMWGKLYSKKCALSGIWMSERKTGSLEDAVYNLGAFEKCSRCVYINEFLYHYRKDNTETTTGRYREQLVSQWEVLYDFLEKYIKEHNCTSEYETALQNRIALGLLGLGLNELTSSKGFFGKAQALRVILNKPRWKQAYRQLQFKYFPIKWKVFYGLCKLKWTELLIVMLFIIAKLKSVLAK